MTDVIEQPDEPDKQDIRSVRVGLPGGTVHEFELDTSLPVSTVVARVLDVEKLDPASARVRIISSGKLVRDHNVPLADILTEGSFLHAAVSERPPQPQRESSGDGTEVADTDDHGGDANAPVMLSAVGFNSEVRILIPNLTTTGFERLSLAGFNDEEIRMIQRQLRLMRRETSARSDNGEEEEEWFREIADGEGQGQAEAAEEGTRIRIHRQDHHNVLSSGAEGTNGDFLMGCIFGYLLGIIVLVLLLDNNATRRWRVGIIAGVATNCAFGILRTSLFLRGSISTAP